MKTFEGTLDLRRHPIDPEHYHTVAKATAEALAAEIAARMRKVSRRSNHMVIEYVAMTVLRDWFLGKWTPGGPTDPQPGAPTQEKK